jgi:hypothetical protein
MHTRHLIAAAIALACAGANAQTATPLAPPTSTPTAGAVQRDVNQEKRIEAGLKDGSLSTREAARLEKEQAHVDRIQAQALKDGKLSDVERARLAAAQNKTSADIAAARHNAVKGDPTSVSSQRLQTDVARNVSQQQRIENGVKNGSLTNKEVARLERGQAHVDAKEAKAGANGHVSAAEQRSVQRTENRQSKRIHQQKTDAQTRG